MKKLLSAAVTTAFSIGAQKLGHPVPLSNFVVEENSGGWGAEAQFVDPDGLESSAFDAAP